MFRHMVLFRFRAGTGHAGRQTVLRGLASLPSRFPAIQRFGLGENVSTRDATFTHVMTMEFETRAQMEGYLSSAEHEAFVAQVFRPSVEARAIASYEVGESDLRQENQSDL
jgi:hypothetical protein